MKKDGKFIFAIGLSIVFVIYAIILIVLDFSNKTLIDTYLLLAENSTWKCDQNKCKTINQSEVPNHTTFKVANTEGLNYGNFTVDYVNKWNFLDEQGTFRNDLDQNFIAYTNDKIKVINKTQYQRNASNEEKDLIAQYLEKRKITNYKLSSIDVVNYDFNHNGKDDQIIIATNDDEESQEKYFIIVLSVIDGKGNELAYDEVSIKEYYFLPFYYVNAILNLGKEKEDVLILSKGYFSEVGKTTNAMYRVSHKKLEKLMDDEEK